MRRRNGWAAALVAGVLVLGACGGDDDDVAVATTAAGGASETTAGGGGSDTTAGGGSSDTTAGGGASETSAPSFSGDKDSEFCTKLRDFEDSQTALDNLPQATPDDLKQSLQEAEDQLKELQGSVPDEIEGDLETLAVAFGRFNDVFEKYDWDFQKVIQAATTDPDALKVFEESATDIEAASTNLAAYSEQVCGVTSG